MVYANASAPPLYLLQQQQLANEAAKKSAETHQKPNLKDDCSVCLVPLGNQPDGDFNEGVVLAKPECPHFFHEFCLEKWIGDSLTTKMYKACPLCNRLIKKIDRIPVEANPANATPQPTDQIHSPEEGPSVAARIGETAVNGAIAVTKGVASGTLFAVKAAFKFLTTESAQTTKDRRVLIEHRLAQLNIKWNSMPKMFENEKNKMEVTISLVRSLIDNHSKEPIEAINSSKATEKQVGNLEKYTEAFEQNIKKAQLALCADLEKLENELAKIIK